MSHKNPIHEAILKNVIRPAMAAKKMSVEGSVMNVNYLQQTCRVYWRDPDAGAERESENVPLPIDGDGVFKSTIEEGDRVTLGFRNGNHYNPYIVMVHEKQRGVSHEAKYGSGIPKGMGFF